MAFAATCERVMTGSYEDASADERGSAVRDLIVGASVVAAAASVQPIPVLDVALLIPTHITLVQAIGRVHGYDLDKKAVVEVLGTFGVSMVAQHAVRSAVRLIPGLGWVLGASMGYAMTYAIGEVADHYFRTGRGVPASELRSMFEKTYRAKRAERDGDPGRDRTLKQRLDQLRDAFEAGLISSEEFSRMKEEILARFYARDAGD